MIADGSSDLSCLANFSVASFPGINKCPGIHCSLAIKEKTAPTREFEKKKGSEREKKNMADLVLPKPAEKLLNGAGLSKLGLPKSKE